MACVTVNSGNAARAVAMANLSQRCVLAKQNATSAGVAPRWLPFCRGVPLRMYTIGFFKVCNITCVSPVRTRAPSEKSICIRPPIFEP
eukprot:4684125-Lingulodinium_polyedra.AAC.1